MSERSEAKEMREEFVRKMWREGLPMEKGEQIYRHAATWHRFAVESCNRPLTAAEEKRWDVAQQRIKLLCEAHGIKPVFEALDVRLKVPSGLDDGWGGVFVPRRAGAQ